ARLLDSWLNKMFDARLAETSEFAELADALLVVQPDAPERVVAAHYDAWWEHQRDRDFAAARLVAFGKVSLPAVAAGLEAEAKHAVLSKHPSISRLPVVLARLGPVTIPVVQKALHHESPHVRCQAVRVLALMDPKAALEAWSDLTAALADS